jgi:S-(hydroxymethyl)glutathione dehydrogenase / alcohol dehydrogenase
MKTIAAILVEQRKPLEIAEVEIPALHFGQVLVEIKATRICGSQIGEIDGVKGPDRYLPHLLGHEAGGVVLETGPEVTHVKPGDHVVVHWRPGNGIQAKPTTYQWGEKTVNAGNITTFQQYAVISENRLTIVPKELDSEIAALLADTLTTGFGIVTRDAAVSIGESIVFFGAGGIGLGAILGAHLAGAYPIVAIDLHDHKLAKAREFGATHTINAKHASSLDEEIRNIIGNTGADVTVDGTGQAAVIEQCYRLTSNKGRTVLFGVLPHDKTVNIHTLPLHFGRVLTGSEGGGSLPSKDIPRFVRMMQAGKFDPSGFVSHRLSLPEINTGISKMRSGEVVHAMVHF